jgi:cysteine desulfurase/selenocysteine lyase
MQIESIRAEFPALANYGWFQNGGVSITPRVVHDEFVSRMEEILQRGPVHIVYPDEEYPRRDRSRQILADCFGVDREELALVRGVSEAFQAVLCGLDWRAGDKIVISSDEEAALVLPVLHLSQQQRVEVLRLPINQDIPQQLDTLSRFIDQGGVRLLAVSHVTTDVGFRFAVQELCELARQHDVLSFVDTAHSAGLFPIDLKELACDFAGILSYKWMYGPYAAGLFYANRDSLTRLAVRFAGGRSEAWLDFEANEFELSAAAQRFEYGPWSWPLIHAWAKGAEYLQRIGFDAIWQRTRLLIDRLRSGLERLPGIDFFTPADSSASASLLSFGLSGWTGEALAAELRDRFDLIVKALPHTRQGLRVSVPFFLLEEEIDRLVDAVGQLTMVE